MRGRFAWLSLRGRLVLVGVVGVALALLVAGFAFYSALTLAVNRSLDREALASADEVVVLVDEDRLPSPIPISGTQVVQVVDAEQRVVGGSATADRLTPLLRPAELTRALAGEAVEVDGSRLALSGPLRVRAAAAGPADARVAVIVAVPVGDVLATRSALRTGLLLTFPVVLAVLGLVAWRVIGRTLRPVEELRVGAEQISGSGRGDRLPVPVAADEIRALALTLNGMLDRLGSARARQRAFVADAAHELRSPLTSMRTQLEVARHVGEGGELAEDLLAEVDRLSVLVEDLLLLARTDADAARPPQPEVVDLRRLLADLAAEPTRPGVRVDTPPGPAVTAYVDPGELRRVLANLTTNAVRHARSRVVLDVREDPDGVRLTVTDDGPGIAADDRERVFERFTRLDDARSRDAGGSGLGLPIVAELVARAGGTVRLDAGPDGGLRAEITLPAAPLTS